MKKLLLILACLLTFTISGCVKTEDYAEAALEETAENPIPISTRSSGRAPYQINEENPYSLQKVQEALDIIAGPDAPDLTATHHYVRFLPQDTMDMYILVDSLDLGILPYPFDYDDMTQEEMDMHENTLINGYAWQYCLVPSTFQVPTEMVCELLDYAYLQSDDEAGATRAPGSQLDPAVYSAAIDMAMEITGNATPQTRSTWKPSATIKYNSGIDREAVMPLKNVLVRANTTYNRGEAYTDANGNVTISKGWGGKFKRRVRYKIIWKTPNWKIHDGSGKAKHEGPRQHTHWDFTIQGGESSKVAMCATIHRALNAYYFESHPKTDGLVKDLYIHVRARWNESSEDGVNGNFSGWRYNQIHIYSRACDGGQLVSRTNRQMLSTTFHELGHASHRQAVISWPGMNRWEHYEDSYICETWANGVRYAYMSSLYPNVLDYNDVMNYGDASGSDDYTAVIESLMNQGITLNQLQNIFMGERHLDHCIQPVKNLGIAPPEIVDMIFNSPFYPVRINMSDPITGPDSPGRYENVKYSVPEGLPTGVIFKGWTIDPIQYHVTNNQVALKNLNISFNASTRYTITANFLLPNKTTYSVAKTVNVNNSAFGSMCIYGPTDVSRNIANLYGQKNEANQNISVK